MKNSSTTSSKSPTVQARGPDASERGAAELGCTHDRDVLAKLIGACGSDIKTPLASLLASSEMLVEEMGPNHHCSGYARAIHDVSSRLQGTMLDLAVFSLPMKLHLRCLDLAAFARQELDRFRPRAEKMNVWLFSKISDREMPVWGDSDALRLALTRLLDHQVLATAMQSGGTLEVVLEKRDRRRTHLLFIDTGATVQHELVSRVFEPYFNSEGRHPSMALAIVRRMIEEQGGKVAAWQNRHGGLTVELQLRSATCSDLGKEQRHELQEAEES